jgi:lysyl-tRNA synthetase, class II
MEQHNALSEIISSRYKEIKSLREQNVDVFPHRVEVSHDAQKALSSEPESKVSCAGRIVQLRLMGKASFAHLQDASGKIQLYVKKENVGDEAYDMFKKHVHIGDFIKAEGEIFITKTQEKTINVKSITILAKAVRPMPEKWHGLQDMETRFRQRHLDLMSSAEVRDIFKKRSKIISAARRTLDNRGFLEVETPTLCSSAGGASATPFETFHNALDMPLFMRIATELYLKRLIIGGLDRVYEIGKIFRNEGIDTRHNPEFTMLELYQAYADYNTMAETFEAIVAECIESLGIDSVEYRGERISLKPPFRRLYLPEMWKDKCGEDIHEILDGKLFNRKKLLELANKLKIDSSIDTPSAKVFERIFDEKILPLLKEPAFVMDHPTAITPLAKCKPGDTSLVERFEFFAGTEEVANAYTELNDPEDQMERLTEQMRQKQSENNKDVDVIDKDFVHAMESGMPPTGGMGIGIDRLTMLLTGKASIREVILFPTLKAEVNKDRL